MGGSTLASVGSFAGARAEVCDWSSGVEPLGNVVLKPAAFLVETVEAGLGEVLVYVEDPEGHTEEVHTHTHTWSPDLQLMGEQQMT